MKATILTLAACAALLLPSCATAPKQADPVDLAMAAWAQSILTAPVAQEGGAQ